MTKPVFKTLSLSVMAFVLATTPAPAEPDQVACSTRHAIDLGWEYQQGLLEGRLEARAAASIEVKGAIISPPFPTYAPYRQDVLRGSVDPIERLEAKPTAASCAPRAIGGSVLARRSGVPGGSLPAGLKRPPRSLAGFDGPAPRWLPAPGPSGLTLGLLVKGRFGLGNMVSGIGTRGKVEQRWARVGSIGSDYG